MVVECNQASAAGPTFGVGICCWYIADQDLEAVFNPRKMMTDQSSGQYSGEIDQGTNQSSAHKNLYWKKAISAFHGLD